MRRQYKLEAIIWLLMILVSMIGLPAGATISAKSYIVLDSTGQVLAQKNPDAVRPIASITKLFTVQASAAADRTELIKITSADVRAGRMRSSPLRVDHWYSRKELIDLALVSSDNIAAIALGRTASIPFKRATQRTSIVEASGLNPANVSTARELALEAQSLVGSFVARTSIQPTVTVQGVVRRSTNPLLRNPKWVFEVSKTGFINPAGGCLVVVFRAGGRMFAAAILGSRDVRTRWKDLAQLREQVLKESVTRSASVTTERSGPQ